MKSVDGRRRSRRRRPRPPRSRGAGRRSRRRSTSPMAPIDRRRSTMIDHQRRARERRRRPGAACSRRGEPTIDARAEGSCRRVRRSVAEPCSVWVTKKTSATLIMPRAEHEDDDRDHERAQDRVARRGSASPARSRSPRASVARSPRLGAATVVAQHRGRHRARRAKLDRVDVERPALAGEPRRGARRAPGRPPPRSPGRTASSALGPGDVVLARRSWARGPSSPGKEKATSS